MAELNSVNKYNTAGRKFDVEKMIEVFFAEFFGTALYIVVGCMGCVVGMQNGPVSAAQISMTFGMAVMIAIHLFGHISGAHINPLTSLCAVIMGEISLTLLPVYVTAQLTGSALGYGLLKTITPQQHFNSTGICTLAPSEELTAGQALLVEIFISLILAFANCSSWDYRTVPNQDSAPLRFGFLVAILLMAAGPYSGAGMNPARTFGPALWNNNWRNEWLYWMGPISGGVFGAAFYKTVLLKANRKPIVYFTK